MKKDITITISRSLAHQLQTVFRRALRSGVRGSWSPLGCLAGQERLQIRARHAEVAMIYEEPGCFTPTEFALPWEFLSDCAGTVSDAVQIELFADSIRARWTEANFAQERVYDRPSL